MREWASLPLRIGLGIVFVAHGLQKTFGLFGGPGIDGFMAMLSGFGIVPDLQGKPLFLHRGKMRPARNQRDIHARHGCQLCAQVSANRPRPEYADFHALLHSKPKGQFYISTEE